MFSECIGESTVLRIYSFFKEKDVNRLLYYNYFSNYLKFFSTQVMKSWSSIYQMVQSRSLIPTVSVWNCYLVFQCAIRGLFCKIWKCYWKCFCNITKIVGRRGQLMFVQLSFSFQKSIYQNTMPYRWCSGWSSNDIWEMRCCTLTYYIFGATSTNSFTKLSAFELDDSSYLELLKCWSTEIVRFSVQTLNTTNVIYNKTRVLWSS